MFSKLFNQLKERWCFLEEVWQPGYSWNYRAFRFKEAFEFGQAELKSSDAWKIMGTISPEMLSPWYRHGDNGDFLRDQFIDGEVTRGYIQLAFRNGEYILWIGYSNAAALTFNAKSFDEAKEIVDKHLRNQKYIID